MCICLLHARHAPPNLQNIHVHFVCLQACTSVNLPSEECKTKMGHMSKMFQMYATKEFANGRDLWLAGICRYINDAYASLAVKVRCALPLL